MRAIIGILSFWVLFGLHGYAFGFAEEPITFQDPLTQEIWDEQISTVHSDIVYALALAAGFTETAAATLTVYDQLVDSERLGPEDTVTYTNCTGSFTAAPEPAEVCSGGYGEGNQIWPMEYDSSCTTSRYGPYSPFFHFPRQTTNEMGALKEWGWGRASNLAGYAAYAWGDAMDTVYTAKCRYIRTEAINTGLAAGSLEAFGLYLHSLADSYSHLACINALDAQQKPNLWGTHTITPTTVPECYYVPSNPKNSDAHGQEFGPDSSGTPRTDAAIEAVYNELIARSKQREGRYYPLSLTAKLKSLEGQPTLQTALLDFVHTWNFQKTKEAPGVYADNRRALAQAIAQAAVAQRKKAVRPTVSSISPTAVTIGSTPRDVKITIVGTNFSTKCRAQFQYNNIKTTYISPTELTAIVPASFALPGTSGKIRVYNTSGGGSNAGLTLKFK